MSADVQQPVISSHQNSLQASMACSLCARSGHRDQWPRFWPCKLRKSPRWGTCRLLESQRLDRSQQLD